MEKTSGSVITLVQPFPALLLQVNSKRILVVADLHIGWEAALAGKGVHVPSQTPKILERLLQLVRLCKPTSIIFLGDVKHAIARVEIEEWRDIPDLFDSIIRRVPDVQVIPGNHDGNLEPLLPESVRVLPYTGVVLGDVGLFHGHAWPAPELLGCRSLVIGHVHPVVSLRDPMGFWISRQVWVRVECDGEELARSFLRRMGGHVRGKPSDFLWKHFGVKLRVSRLLIMPSFNEFLGGQPINRKSMRRAARSRELIGPVLRSRGVNLSEAEIYLLDGTFLGTVNQLVKLTYR